jgi:hypothetical protein
MSESFLLWLANNHSFPRVYKLKEQVGSFDAKISKVKNSSKCTSNITLLLMHPLNTYIYGYIFKSAQGQ